MEFLLLLYYDKFMFLLVKIIDYFKILIKELVDKRYFCCKIKDLDIYCFLNENFEVENVEFLVMTIFLYSFVNVYLEFKIVICDNRESIDRYLENICDEYK